jgi:hypothetical protein
MLSEGPLLQPVDNGLHFQDPVALNPLIGHVPRKVLCGSSEQKRGTWQEIVPHDDEVWIK